MSLESGQRLGHYEILGRLGSGGMGEVYRARDTRLDRDVALKVLPDAFADDPSRLERFEREAKAIAALSHPNILAIHDYGREGGIVYAAMELLEGSTLREVLDADGVPQSKAIDYAVQVCDGLAAAHERGVIHRDLKPENLMVSRDGRVKILDFGLAKVVAPVLQDESGAPTATAHTGPGVVMGTVGYMSPEQVRGQEADARSDVFSLGLVLYEMLAGRRAFSGDSAVETMSAILKEDPPELSGQTSGLPPGLEAIVRHCLEKHPEERFQSVRDLAFSLRSVAATATVTGEAAMLTGAPPRRRRTSLLAAAAFCLAGILAGGVTTWLALGARGESSPGFQTLTFRRGVVWSARWAPDGRTVVYGAGWEGSPLEVFSTNVEAPGSRALPFGAADVLSVSANGELAISLGRHFTYGFETSGTLARVPLDGGAPRELLEGVHEADWGPDGRDLAIVRDVDGRMRLEYPVGEVLYESDGWISRIRFSPDGKRIGFIDHPVRGDNVGAAAVVDLDGNVTRLGQGGSWGLVWSVAGDEVWVSTGLTVDAYTLRGRRRLVHRSPQTFALLDRAPDGRLLVGASSIRREIVGRGPGQADERNLSWFDWSTLRDLSADGRTLLFDEGNRFGPDGYWFYLRGIDGSPPVRLGEGLSLALSPAGDQALILRRPFDRPELRLLPTGAGEARLLPLGELRPQPRAAWLPGREAFLFAAAEPGQPTGIYLQKLTGGETRSVTPKGIRFSYDAITVSPDGAWLVTSPLDGPLTIYSIDGTAEPRAVPGTLPGELPIQWSADGRRLFVYSPGAIPTPVFLLDIDSGERTLWRELTPSDPAGVFNVDKIAVTGDGSAYAYSYRRIISRLLVVDGLR